MANIRLGLRAGGVGEAISIDVQRLVESRMLLQANSGAGKSWALRRILEQTHGKLQQIVLDVEDEFHTLREKYDYVLAGEGGDCPANSRCAALLARRLLELNVSAIVRIYELKRHEQYRFVKLFLEALVNAPRKLWHPALVVIDEAHIFCPQNGSAESQQAVIELMSKGRKRGFCGVLATQRLSKLHKDACAEANNKLIGRCAMDIDMKRAADELGFNERGQALSIRALHPGYFYAFGPAICDDVTQLKIGKVLTTHPKAGARSTSVSPPRSKVLKVLSKLKDLPEEAAKHEQTLKELKSENIKLRRELSKKAPVIDKKQLEEAHRNGADIERAELLGRLTPVLCRTFKALEELQALCSAKAVSSNKKLKLYKGTPFIGASLENLTTRPVRFEGKAKMVPTGLSKCERAILSVLAQHETRTKTQVAIISGYSHKSGSFNNSLSSLRTAGYLEGNAEQLRCTDTGIDAISGAVHPLPEGADLLRYWCAHKSIGLCGRKILSVLSEEPGHSLSKEEVAERTEYSAASGSFNNTLSRLRTLALISGSKVLTLSPDLT